MIVAVLLPSKGRAEKLAQVLVDLTHQLQAADLKILVVVAALVDEAETIAAAKRAKRKHDSNEAKIDIILRSPGTTSVEGWNQAYRHAYQLGADWFVLGADDVNFYAGCIAAAVEEAQKTGCLVIGLNDMHTDLNKYGPHYMASRKFTRDHLGGVMAPPMYKAWWFDREVCEIAQEVSTYAPAYRAIAKHDHHTFSGEPAPDETYREAEQDRERDKVVYLERKAAGWPIDYEPVIGERNG